MPDERDRDDERDDLEDEERDEEADEAEEDDADEADDGEDESDDEDESDAEDAEGDDAAADDADDEEEPPPPKRKRARKKKAAAAPSADERKKKAARKKASERKKSTGERRRRSDEGDKASDRPRGEARRKGKSKRARAEEPERAPAPKRRRKGGGKRKRKEAEPSAPAEIREPAKPPEPDVDLSAPLEPAWEQGLVVGGGLSLGSVALGVASLLYSGGRVTAIPIVALGLLMVATAFGGFGVLVRRSWGYVLGVGAGGLGVIAGVLWTLYGVVTPRISFWFPLAWLACNVATVIVLFRMRWGPGPLADSRDRLRSLKLRTLAYTTMHGELAYSGAIAALLGSLLALGLLLGSEGSQRPSSPVAQYAEGMQLEALTEAPEEGSLVLARWGSEVYFFLGRVADSREGDEFHIQYLDGDQEWVRMADLRQDTVRAGSVVHVHVQGHEGWLPAQVTQRTGDRVEVDLGSRRVWVPLAMVRIREQ